MIKLSLLPHRVNLTSTLLNNFRRNLRIKYPLPDIPSPDICKLCAHKHHKLDFPIRDSNNGIEMESDRVLVFSPSICAVLATLLSCSGLDAQPPEGLQEVQELPFSFSHGSLCMPFLPGALLLMKPGVLQPSKASTRPGRSRPTFLSILKALGSLCVTARGPGHPQEKMKHCVPRRRGGAGVGVR